MIVNISSVTDPMQRGFHGLIHFQQNTIQSGWFSCYIADEETESQEVRLPP